jgi:hypothetical protein
MTLSEAMDELATCESADQVAEYFLQRQITGVVRNSFYCPVANYLRQQGLKEPCVMTHFVSTTADSDTTTVTMPWPVADFVRFFDELKYPALIAPNGL